MVGVHVGKWRGASITSVIVELRAGADGVSTEEVDMASAIGVGRTGHHHRLTTWLRRMSQPMMMRNKPTENSQRMSCVQVNA